MLHAYSGTQGRAGYNSDQQGNVSLRSRVVFLLGRIIPGLLGSVTTAVLTLLPSKEYGIYALGLSLVFFLTIGAFEWLGLSLIWLAPAVGLSKSCQFFGTVVTCFLGLCGLCTVVTLGLVLTGLLSSWATLVSVCLGTSFSAAWFELNQRLQLAELREVEYLRSGLTRGAIAVVLVPLTAFLCRNATLAILALGISYIGAAVQAA